MGAWNWCAGDICHGRSVRLDIFGWSGGLLYIFFCYEEGLCGWIYCIWNCAKEKDGAGIMVSVCTLYVKRGKSLILTSITEG